MMVASHKMDILAAKECGLVTAYINRPYEFGDYFTEFDQIEESIDYWAPDIESLAEQLRNK
jgi:2-haloacid dehalogenase